MDGRVAEDVDESFTEYLADIGRVMPLGYTRNIWRTVRLRDPWSRDDNSAERSVGRVIFLFSWTPSSQIEDIPSTTARGMFRGIFHTRVNRQERLVKKRTKTERKASAINDTMGPREERHVSLQDQREKTMSR